MPYADKEKEKLQAKKRWQRIKDDPEVQEGSRKRKREARHRSKELVLKWKTQGCKHCGEMEPICLAAHHREPEHKDNTINRLIANRAGPETLHRELAKCDCVCANCHLKIHAGLITDGNRI